MQIYNFVVLSVIVTSHNVLTLHINKNHLPTLFELMLKRAVNFPSPPPFPTPTLQTLNIYKTELPLVMEVYVFQMRFNLNKIFASDV